MAVMFLLISPQTDFYQSLPLLFEVSRMRFVLLDIVELNQKPTGQLLHRCQRAMETFHFLVTEEIEIPREYLVRVFTVTMPAVT